jgi:hypothetical protein
VSGPTSAREARLSHLMLFPVALSGGRADARRRDIHSRHGACSEPSASANGASPVHPYSDAVLSARERRLHTVGTSFRVVTLPKRGAIDFEP